MKIAALFGSAALVASEAETIISAAEFFMQQAEAAGVATPKTGEQKLAAVKTALSAYVAANYPALKDKFEALWTPLTGVIAGLVSLYHSLGVFVSTKRAPLPA